MSSAKAEIESKEKERQADEQSSDRVELTPELFKSLISQIKEKLETEDKNLELAILNQELEFHSSEVSIQVFGHVQEEIAKKMIPSMVQFFRESGKVSSISFKLDIQEEEDQSAQRMYTNSEKFEYLKKKHGALGEFQRKFGLQTDF